MDLSVDPCDDFYQFACGHFRKGSAVKDKEMLQSQYTLTQNTVWIKLLTIVTEPIQPNEQKPLKTAKLLYKSCMDKGKISKNLLLFSCRIHL